MTERFSIEDVLEKVRALRPTPPPDAKPMAPWSHERRPARAVELPLLPLPPEERLDASRKAFAVGDFFALSEEAMIDEAYRVILGREPDALGRGHYVENLRKGAPPAFILMAMRYSAEGRRRGLRIRRLLPAYALARFATLPVLGRFLSPLVAVVNLPGTLQRLQRRQAVIETRHKQTIEAGNRTLLAMRRTLVQMGIDADAMSQTVERHSTELTTVGEQTLAEMRAMREQSLRQSERLQTLLLSAGDQLTGTSLSGTPAGVEIAAHDLDGLYLAFENRFRGSRAEIADKIRGYLPLFQNNRAVAAGGVVLDIGCGRGEWLRLLSDHNIAARGVDLNDAMAAACREQGLDAVAGDAIAYLRGLPPASLGAVTGFHVVEHLQFEVLIAMLDAARHALMPGGAILFETPNPENLVVGGCTFNNDPTHNKPLPPEVLRFLAEARGFVSSRIIRERDDIDLEQPESGFKPTEVNDWFRLPMDYALFARIPGTQEAS